MFWGEENLPKLNISFSLHLVSCVQKVITNTLVPQAMSKKMRSGLLAIISLLGMSEILVYWFSVFCIIIILEF